MTTIPNASRIVALLLVAMTFLLAVMQPVLGLVFFFLIPFWFFLADVLSLPLPTVGKVRKALPFFALPVFSPRPPPVR